MSDSYTMLFIDFFSLLRNPVTTKKHYRLYIIFKVPQLRVIDFQRIRQKVNLNGLTRIYDSCVLYPHFSYHLHIIATFRDHYLSVNRQWQQKYLSYYYMNMYYIILIAVLHLTFTEIFSMCDTASKL